MKGKAAVFHEAGKPFELRELDLPELEPGSILLRLTHAGVCGSDLHYWRGDMKPFVFGKPGPSIVGHEACGIVYKMSPQVKTDSLGRPLKEGDRVTYAFFFPCGRCYWCTRGDLANCPNRMVFRRSVDEWPYCSGGFAQYSYLRPGHFVFKVPDELPDEMVVSVNCALSQVLYGLEQAGLRFGDTVVVQGAGGLGLYACAVARDMGASSVIAIDGVPGRLALARQCGADQVVDINQLPEPKARIERVLELTAGRGADVVVEVAGFPAVVLEGLQMVRRGGTYVEIGNIAAGSELKLDVSFLATRGIRLLGFIHYQPYAIPRALDFLVRTRGKYALDRIISHKFPLEQIDEAFKQAEWMGRQKDVGVTRAVVTP